MTQIRPLCSDEQVVPGPAQPGVPVPALPCHGPAQFVLKLFVLKLFVFRRKTRSMEFILNVTAEISSRPPAQAGLDDNVTGQGVVEQRVAVLVQNTTDPWGQRVVMAERGGHARGGGGDDHHLQDDDGAIGDAGPVERADTDAARHHRAEAAHLQCSAVQCSAAQCSVAVCNAARCSAMQSLQCSAVLAHHCTALHCTALHCTAPVGTSSVVPLLIVDPVLDADLVHPLHCTLHTAHYTAHCSLHCTAWP